MRMLTASLQQRKRLTETNIVNNIVLCNTISIMINVTGNNKKGKYNNKLKE